MLTVPSIQKTPSFKRIMNRNKGQSSSLPRQKTIHSGWLWKKGALHTQLVNKRWFEIKGDQMYYFKAEGDTTLLGQISLAGNVVKRLPISTDGNCKYTFALVAGKERQGRPVTDNFESLLFGTSKPDEMEKWIKAINRVIYTPYGGGMFGRSIKETLKIESHRGGGMTPIIVELCVEYIRKHGLKEEGIFRIPGSKEDVESLKDAFNTGSLQDLEEGRYKVSIVASVMKQYLGDLPEPVIPSENYDQFIAVGGLYKEDPECAVKKFGDLLLYIPKEHFDLLKYLCRFLYELQTYSSYTKMTVENLSLVFGPNILHPPGANPSDLLRCLAEANTTIMALILNHQQLFPVTDDEKCYEPKQNNICNDLIDLDFSGMPSLQKASSSITMKSTDNPTGPLHMDKRSLSDSSLTDLLDVERTRSISTTPTYKDEIQNLQKELREQKLHYEERIVELEKKLKSEMKVQEMLKLRLKEEVKARKSVEENIELYRSGIEDYCRKFGHVDIVIR